MIKKLIYTTTLALFGLALNAQIKVYTGGNTVIGATPSSAPTSAAMQIIGNSVFSSATTAITSSAYIRGLNGYSTATTPDYTWYGNDQVGIFHPASNVMAFTNSGSEKMRLGNYSLLLGSTTDDVGTIAVTAPLNRLVMQSWSNYNFDWGTVEQVNVNRANTHAYMLFNNTSTVTPVFHIEGTGDCTGKSFTSTSDKNLKENIDTLRNALNKLKQLNGVTYNFKQAVTGLALNKKEVGLLAQDVEAILPEVVYTSEKGIKSIAYGNITALLIEAIKEQDKKIAQLQNDLIACCNKGTGQRSINPGTGSNNQKTTINPSIAENSDALTSAKLYQNNPNPFTQTTVVKCFIPNESKNASLLIFDLNGTLKKTITITDKGTVNTTINGRELISGMYYYTLLIDGQEIDTKKMILTE